MINESYWLDCDECGFVLENNSDILYMTSENQLMRAARKQGWVKTELDDVYCNECWKEEGGRL